MGLYTWRSRAILAYLATVAILVWDSAAYYRLTVWDRGAIHVLGHLLYKVLLWPCALSRALWRRPTFRFLQSTGDFNILKMGSTIKGYNRVIPTAEMVTNYIYTNCREPRGI